MGGNLDVQKLRTRECARALSASTVDIYVQGRVGSAVAEGPRRHGVALKYSTSPRGAPARPVEKVKAAIVGSSARAGNATQERRRPDANKSEIDSPSLAGPHARGNPSAGRRCKTPCAAAPFARALTLSGERGWLAPTAKDVRARGARYFARAFTRSHARFYSRVSLTVVSGALTLTISKLVLWKSSRWRKFRGRQSWQSEPFKGRCQPAKIYLKNRKKRKTRQTCATLQNHSLNSIEAEFVTLRGKNEAFGSSRTFPQR